MELTLILSDDKEHSAATQQIWQELCLQHRIRIEVLYYSDTRGNKLSRKLGIQSFPALISVNRVVAVGHPDRPTAERIIDRLARPGDRSSTN